MVIVRLNAITVGRTTRSAKAALAVTLGSIQNWLAKNVKGNAFTGHKTQQHACARARKVGLEGCAMKTFAPSQATVRSKFGPTTTSR